MYFVKSLFVVFLISSCLNNNNAHLVGGGTFTKARLSIELPNSITLNTSITFNGTCFPDGQDISVSIDGASPSSVGPCPCVVGEFVCPAVSYDQLPEYIDVVASNGIESTADSNNPGSSQIPATSLVTIDSIPVDTISPTIFTGTCSPNMVGSLLIDIPGAIPTNVGPCDCINSTYSCPAITFTTLPTVIDATVTNSEGYGGPTTATNTMNVPSAINITGPVNLTPGLNTFVGNCDPDGTNTISISIPGATPANGGPCDCMAGSFSCDMTIVDSPASPVVTATNTGGIGGPTTDNLNPTVPELVNLTNPGSLTIGENIILSGSCFPSGGAVNVNIAGANPSTVGPCNCVSGSFSCPSISFSELPANPSFVANYGTATDTENISTESLVDLVNPGVIDTTNPVVLTGTCAPDGTNNISISLATGYSPISAGPCSCISGSFTCPAITFTTIADDPPTITASETTGANGAATDSEVPTVAPQVGAIDDTINSLYATDTSSFDVSLNDTDRNCSPITYTIANEVNVTVSGTAPLYDITPTLAGAWSFEYTATCSDGTTSDVGTVGGVALAPADLVTTITVDDANPGEAQNVTFTITVTNNGPGNSTNVSLTDLCPTGTTYVSGIASTGTYDVGTGLWSIGSIDTPNLETLELECKVSQPITTVVTNNTTSANADQFDPTTTGDSLAASFTVTAKIDLMTPTSFPAGPGLPLNGTCSPLGTDNISISAPSMIPSPITCSCVDGNISCPTNVVFDGSVTDPVITAVLTLGGSTVTDSETIEMSELADVFGPYNGWYSEDGTGGLCFKGIDNKVYCWGDLTGGPGTSEYPALLDVPDSVYLVSTESNAFAITMDGKLYGWGYDASNYAGPGHGGSADGFNEPSVVAGPGEAWDGDNRSIVHFSGDHTDACAVLDNGEFWTWGVNEDGELGIGTEDIKEPIPVQVLDPANPIAGNFVTNATKSFCGGDTHCYEDTSGKVYCSGSNAYGQLGQGTGSTTKSSVYLEVPGISNVLDIGVESWATTVAICVLKSDNTVWCWGEGKGAGDVNTDTPTQWVDSSSNPITGVSKIRSGHHHTCAMKSDGTVWCQGVNDSGQLGDGTYTDSRSVAIQVPGITDAVDISVGREHSCVLRSNDTIWCWGSNSQVWNFDATAEVNGQLGQLSTPNEPSPVQFMPALGNIFRSVKAFAFDTCGLLYSGEIYCMGKNPGTPNEGTDPVGNFIHPQPPIDTANLLTTVTKDKDNYLEGETIVYTINLKNLGPDAATNIIATTSCPTGTTFVSSTPTSGVFDSNSGQWSLSGILNTLDESLEIQCSVDLGVVIGGLTTNLNVTTTLTEDDPTISGNNVPFETFVAFIPAVQCGSDYTGLVSYKSAGDGALATTAYEIGNIDMYMNYLNSGIDRDKHMILCDDIDFSSITNPIDLGTFTGHLNGNGNKISNFNSINGFIYYLRTNGSLKNVVFENITLQCSGVNYCALVERLDDAEIDNITIQGSSTITSDKAYTAALVGYATGLTTITNITSNADVTSTLRTDNAGATGYTGGIVGYALGEELLLENISASGDIIADSSALGGVVGQIQFSTNQGLVKNVSSSGSITYSDASAAVGSYIGGIVGRVFVKAGAGKNLMENLSFSGSLSATQARSNYVGGAIGHLDGIDASDFVEVKDSNVLAAGGGINCSTPAFTSTYCGGFVGGGNDYSQIINSTSEKAVTGDKYVGGFAGYFTDHGLLDTVVASGNVSCTQGYCAGLIGYSTNLNTINNSVALGDVTYVGSLETNSYFGGLIGAALSGNVINNCAYEGSQVLGARHTGGLVGYFNTTALTHVSSITNSYVNSASVGTIAGTDNTLNAGGLIGYAYIRYIDMDIEGVFVNIANLSSSRSMAGLIFDVNLLNDTTLNISQAFVKGAATFDGTNPNNYQFGGFIGELSWSGAAVLNVSDSYTEMSLDTTNLNLDTGSYSAIGGFVGYKYRANSNFTNVYENTGVTLDGKLALRYGGGFLGYDRTSATYSTTLVNSFTTSSYKDFVTSTDFVFGGLGAGSAPIVTNSFYLDTATCSGTPCDGSLGGSSSTITNLQVSTNAPLNSWDFTSTWLEVSGEYPDLLCPTGAPTAFCTEWNNAQ